MALHFPTAEALLNPSVDPRVKTLGHESFNIWLLHISLHVSPAAQRNHRDELKRHSATDSSCWQRFKMFFRTTTSGYMEVKGYTGVHGCRISSQLQVFQVNGYCFGLFYIFHGLLLLCSLLHDKIFSLTVSSCLWDGFLQNQKDVKRSFRLLPLILLSKQMTSLE